MHHHAQPLLEMELGKLFVEAGWNLHLPNLCQHSLGGINLFLNDLNLREKN
jgi:hypothetical protein